MRAILQRVQQAEVQVEGKVVGSIGSGLLIYLGIGHLDTNKDIEQMATKIPKIRIFQDDQGKMNQSLLEGNREALVVSQFTLCGSLRKGNRPSFNDAAPPDRARAYYDTFVQRLSQCLQKTVPTGVFAAEMKVYSINDGPVTLWLDNREI